MKQHSLERTFRSAQETMTAGRKIGRLLRAGDIVALKGNLGAGKTTWVKGACKGLDVPKEAEVASPTFVVIHEYKGREKIFHLDWYRLKKVEGADQDLAEECFLSKAVTFVEWPERGKALLPPEALWFEFTHVSPEKRKLTIRPGKKTRPELVASLEELL